jgi:photosystem II stability/assembly factor-like uncharacterized protein
VKARFAAPLAAGLMLVSLGDPSAQRRSPVTADSPTATPRRGPEGSDPASTYARMKRRAQDPDLDTVAAYALAAEQVRALPLYSSRLGAFVDRTGSRGGAHVAAALGTWQPLGPGSLGGRTRTLVIDPVRAETLYTAGVSGGVWKSTDAGANWLPMSDDMANLTVNALVMHPTDRRVLYAGTGEGYFLEEVHGTELPLRGGGIFTSTDSGRTWTRMRGTDRVDFQWVNDLAVSRQDEDRLYAATRTGVWRTDNLGLTWSQVLNPEVKGGCLDLVARTDTTTDVLLASCGTLDQARVYRTTDGASSRAWQEVLSEPGMGRTTLAIAPSDQEVVYALAASNDPGPDGRFEQGLLAVYRSSAGGAFGSWETRLSNTDHDKLATLLLTNPLWASLVECSLGIENSWVNTGWYASTIAVDPIDPDRVWAGGVDLFRSDDGGRTWGVASYWWVEPTSPGWVHADLHGLFFDPRYDGTTQRSLYAVGDGGVFRTANARAPVGMGVSALCSVDRSGVTWTALNRGLAITQFSHGTVFPSGDAYVGGTEGSGTVRGRDKDGANGWKEILGGDGGFVAVDPTDPRRVYAETPQFGLRRSTNGGETFGYATTGIVDPPSTFLYVTPFVLDPNQPRRLWTGGRRLWRSDDGADTWVRASASLVGLGQVSALAVSPHSSDLMLAGTSDGRILRCDHATATTSSTVWDWVRPREGFVSWLVLDPSQPPRAYATYAGFGGPHLWRSEDAGRTWTALDGSGQFPDMPVHCIIVDPDEPRRLYLGTDLGVLVSIDGGLSWASENTGFANVVTESLDVWRTPEGQLVLYAFTHGRGAWRVPLQPAGGRPAPSPRQPSGRLR